GGEEAVDFTITKPTKTTFTTQEQLSADGGKITLENGTEVTLSQTVLSGFDTYKEGEKFVFVTYGGVRKSFKVLVVNLPKKITAEAGEKLSDIELPTSDFGEFTWVNPEAVVAEGSQSYSVKFTPVNDTLFTAREDLSVVIETKSTDNPGGEQEEPEVEEKETFIITLNPDGGTGISDLSLTVEEGESLYDRLKLLTPEKENFTFVGWFLEENGVLGQQITQSSDIAVTSDLTVKAKWEAVDTTDEELEALLQQAASLLKEVEALEGKIAEYTTESYNALNSKATELEQEVAKAQEAGKDILTALMGEVRTAKASLKSKALADALEKETMYSAEEYTEETYRAFTAAIAAGKEALAGTNNLEEQKEKASAIEDAISKLEKKAVPEPEKEKYTVSFNHMGKGIDRSVEVKKGDKLEKPADPTYEGFEFKGWYKEETFTTLWNFENDTVTENQTLYAKWETKSVEPEPEVPVLPDSKAIRVAPIADLVYTGKALKPVVQVYDGEKLLQLNKDYKVTYKNNVNANAGAVEAGEEFNENLPYVIITGKGNYSGTLQVNFNI
ncbi:MAG: InlB B-repeat-containing protein, partial [Lachnospiraceae bacterium]|nr:InlB B-repeat-containing protein [Lachnospiraceae bacterium]